MVKPNPQRDYSSKLATDLGFTVRYDSLSTNRKARTLGLSRQVPNTKSVAELNQWKGEQIAALSNAGFAATCAGGKLNGAVKNGEFGIMVNLPNELNPHYTKPASIPKSHELPKSVANYITGDLGLSVDQVVAHRIVNGRETLYAVLIENKPGLYSTVVFVGEYVARFPLGPYEEATTGNALLTRWSCLYDAGEWEHSVERFKNAPYSYFN